MEFLDIFSLRDVFIAAAGLMLVSMLRIYYDSYVEKKKVKNFGNSLGIYNSLIDNSEEGLLIVSDDNKIVFVNRETAEMLNTNKERIDSSYLESIHVKNEDNGTNESLLEVIQANNNIANAYLLNDSTKLPVSVSINKVYTSPQSYNYWNVVILRDMTSINELRESARGLLEAV